MMLTPCEVCCVRGKCWDSQYRVEVELVWFSCGLIVGSERREWRMTPWHLTECSMMSFTDRRKH